jgi:hypothetical protein
MTIPTFTEDELEERYKILKGVCLTITIPIHPDNPLKDEHAKRYAIFAELARRGRVNAWIAPYGAIWYYTEKTIQESARLSFPMNRA